MTVTPLDSETNVRIRIRWHEAGDVTLGSDSTFLNELFEGDE